MKRPVGFTLIELAIVLAVIAALALVAGATFRSARGNSGTASAAFDLTIRLQGLRTKALAEQKEYVLVLMNPEGNDASRCGTVSPRRCLRWFLLSAPASAWTLGAFSAADPATNASMEDSGSFDRGVVIDVDSAGLAGPAPFDTISLFDPSIRGDCQDEDGKTCRCVAVRYKPTGEVAPVLVATPTSTQTGMAFGLVAGSRDERTGADTHRAVLVSAPTGLVKTYVY